MENKGNKSGNIYQKLKGAGAWQSKDSAGPIIKGVGIKSPLNMKKASPVKEYQLPPGTADKSTTNEQRTEKGLSGSSSKTQSQKNAEARKAGKAVIL